MCWLSIQTRILFDSNNSVASQYIQIDVVSAIPSASSIILLRETPSRLDRIRVMLWKFGRWSSRTKSGLGPLKGVSKISEISVNVTILLLQASRINANCRCRPNKTLRPSLSARKCLFIYHICYILGRMQSSVLDFRNVVKCIIWRPAWCRVLRGLVFDVSSTFQFTSSGDISVRSFFYRGILPKEWGRMFMKTNSQKTRKKPDEALPRTQVDSEFRRIILKSHK